MKLLAAQTDPAGDSTLFPLHDFFYYGMGKMSEAARSAVILFFVLSGFVLAYALGEKPMPYKRYLLKRIFRIYPVFAVVILFSYCCHVLISAQNLESAGWIKYAFNVPDLTAAILLKHLLMFGNQANNGLDIAMWSLVHEMRISLIFPFLLLALVRWGWRAMLSCVLMSVVCSICLLYLTGSVATGLNDAKVPFTFLSTGYFMVFFAGGAFLTLHRQKIAGKIACLTAWKKALLFIGCACCFFKADFDRHTLAGEFVNYMRGIGACILIALALGLPKFKGALQHITLLWLGRISYSLYLVHIPVAYFISHTVGPQASATVVIFLIVTISVAAAELLNRTIEKPFMKLGNALYARLSIARLYHSAADYTKLAEVFTDEEKLSTSSN